MHAPAPAPEAGEPPARARGARPAPTGRESGDGDEVHDLDGRHQGAEAAPGSAEGAAEVDAAEVDAAEVDAAEVDAAEVDAAEVNVEDFRCKICKNLMVKPTTTACGHSFCGLCLQSELEKEGLCPRCKSEMPRATDPPPMTFVLDSLLGSLFNEGAAVRQKDGLTGQLDAGELQRADRKLIKIDPEDTNCSVCRGLMFKPTTTACGHSFCSSCLQAMLLEYEKSGREKSCPKCRRDLSRIRSPLPVSEDLDRLLRQLFPRGTAARREEAAARQLKEADERRAAREQIVTIPCLVLPPILPHQHYDLKVSDPRNRCMVEACHLHNKPFVLVPHQEGSAHENYGTQVRITEYERSRGGSCFFEVVGERACHITSLTTTPEGSMAAQVRYVELEEDLDLNERAAVDAARAEVIVLYNEWYSAIAASAHQGGPPHLGQSSSFSQPGDLAMLIAAQVCPYPPDLQLDFRMEILAAASSLERLAVVRAGLQRALGNLQPKTMLSLALAAVVRVRRAVLAMAHAIELFAKRFITQENLLDNSIS